MDVIYMAARKGSGHKLKVFGPPLLSSLAIKPSDVGN